MNIFLLRRLVIVATTGLLALPMTACVTDVGGGYGYGGNVAVGVDYYEPVGGVYGAWGPGYQVGPYRGGGHAWGGGGGRAHAYRPAAAGRSMPSIPSHSRGSR
jgi:hypothetical protein